MSFVSPGQQSRKLEATVVHFSKVSISKSVHDLISRTILTTENAVY